MEHIKLKISLIQMNVVCGDCETNMGQTETMINKALKQRKTQCAGSPKCGHPARIINVTIVVKYIMDHLRWID